ncbi:hypothetical protein [Pseudoprimorskyibacter insulae]|uniref:hypothetical protein n=1 Tax=Pseudoprimorskyibacter insulae TaxID=1695997 RepID=UPI001C62CD44|nr:hypothetical protein [Pseudoprimorskyibacter insulae]
MTDESQITVFIYNCAERFLVNSLAEGGRLDSALAQWGEEAKVLLGIKKKFRRSVLLVDEEMVLAADAAAPGMSTLLSALGNGVSSLTEVGKPAADPLLMSLAIQTVRCTPEVETLNFELEAIALPHERNFFTLETARRGFGAFQKARQAETDLKAVQSKYSQLSAALDEESDLLQAHISELEASLRDTMEEVHVHSEAETSLSFQLVGQIADAQKNQAERSVLLDHLGEVTLEVAQARATLTSQDEAISLMNSALVSERSKFSKAEKRRRQVALELAASQESLQLVLREADAKAKDDAEALRASEATSASLRKELDTAAKRLSTVEAKAKDDAEALRASEATSASLRKELDTAAKRLSTVEAKAKDDAEALLSERDLLLAHLTELAQELEQKLDVIAGKEAELKKADEALSLEKHTLSEVHERYQSLGREMSRKLDLANKSLQSMQQDMVKLQAAVAQGEALSASQRAEIEAKTVSLFELDQALAELTKGQGRLSSQLAESEQKVASLQAAWTERSRTAQALHDKLEAERSQWHEKLHQAAQREQYLSQQLNLITGEYDKLIGSRSWQVTEPLRSANVLLAKIKKPKK